MSTRGLKKQNQVIVIAGTTASGKSSLAIDIARELNGVIINCDSMQIYKNIPIIAATPSIEERELVEHRLFEIYDCDKRGNVVEWLDLCVTEIRNLWKEKKLPIVVGGTGMYVDALINGVTPIPEVPLNIRLQVDEKLNQQGLDFLYAYLQNIDSEIAQKINHNDKTRIVRAVEIFLATNKKISDWYKVSMIQKIPEAKFFVVKIVPEMSVIEDRCKKRLDKMVYEFGVLDEIKYLFEKNVPENMPAMKALGVPELSLYIKGKLSLEDALNLAKLHTRQYAKRQKTWLRNKLPADIVFDNAYCGQKDYLQQIINDINL